MVMTVTVLFLLVNCRIGSLEKEFKQFLYDDIVNCRIGSLEMKSWSRNFGRKVNCRIGSLETPPAAPP